MTPFLVLPLLIALAPSLQAEAPVETMLDRTAYIELRLSATRAGIGSGFPVSNRHIVTNNHVCCKNPQYSSIVPTVSIGGESRIPAKVLWHAAEKDLAVLELAKPIRVPAVTISRRQYAKPGQDVWVAGFPGASLAVSAAKDPSVTKGVISKILRGAAPGLPAIGFLQVDAAINSGNSGGPLFNACAEVMGINTASVIGAEAVHLSIQTDELIPELDRLGIKYAKASGPCVTESAISQTIPNWMVGGQAIALLAALGALLFTAANRRARTTVTHAARKFTTRIPTPTPAPARAHAPVRQPAPPPPPAPILSLRGLSGVHAGQTVALGDKPCVLGRDPQVANLVFPQQAAHVSKRHCQVIRDPATGRIWLEDLWSSNGTFLASGQRLPGGGKQELRAGDRFYLGGKEDLFEIAPR